MLSESTRTSELHHWKPRHVWPDLKVPFEIPEKTFPKGSDARKSILDAIAHINPKDTGAAL
jgi:hypothetical protein